VTEDSGEFELRRSSYAVLDVGFVRFLKVVTILCRSLFVTRCLRCISLPTLLRISFRMEENEAPFLIFSAK
jgi:hypothetical protein